MTVTCEHVQMLLDHSDHAYMSGTGHWYLMASGDVSVVGAAYWGREMTPHEKMLGTKRLQYRASDKLFRVTTEGTLHVMTADMNEAVFVMNGIAG